MGEGWDNWKDNDGSKMGFHFKDSDAFVDDFGALTSEVNDRILNSNK